MIESRELGTPKPKLLKKVLSQIWSLIHSITTLLLYLVCAKCSELCHRGKYKKHSVAFLMPWRYLFCVILVHQLLFKKVIVPVIRFMRCLLTRYSFVPCSSRSVTDVVSFPYIRCIDCYFEQLIIPVLLFWHCLLI